MQVQAIIKACEDFVKSSLWGAEAGHNWYHIERVRSLALYLQSKEGGDPFSLEMAALLHDISDAKFNGGDESLGAKKSKVFLQELGLEPRAIDDITYLVANCSYKGGHGAHPQSIELKILQDADRLDAIGAIGIARTFNYGGFKNAPMYDPELKVNENQSLEEYREEKGSTINHFYEKLLKLKDGMHTSTARELAENRHQFMLTFLEQFYREWNLDDLKPQ